MLHVKAGRKRICGGTEVVTSGEASEWTKETASKYVKGRNRKEKRKQEEKKKSGDSEQLKRLQAAISVVLSLLPGSFQYLKLASRLICN